MNLRMLRNIAVAAGTLVGALAAPSASAVIVLDFEGVGNFASVGNFYNGGGGTDYNIDFSANSLGIIDSDAGGGGNIANEPSPDTVVFFLSGGAATMNVNDGFTTGFSFFYTSSTIASVTVWDGLNGTGNILATLNLTANAFGCPGDPFGAFACWSPVGVSFAGTAFSVDFGGTADQVAFDNITIGSATPGVPEPASLALLGLGLVGLGARRRRA